MLMFISAAVIMTCLIAMIVILVCCFCSKCPLYSACHSKYHNNDAIAFCKFKTSLTILLSIDFFNTATKEEMERLNGMPDEEYSIQQNSYEPNAVKVRAVEFDA